MYGIFTYIYPKNQSFMLGEYTSPMDPIGIISYYLFIFVCRHAFFGSFGVRLQGNRCKTPEIRLVRCTMIATVMHLLLIASLC